MYAHMYTYTVPSLTSSLSHPPPLLLHHHCVQNGWTPLAFAALCGNPSAVEMLIDAKADITSSDEEGRTPIGLARANINNFPAEKMSATIEVLRRHGAE